MIHPGHVSGGFCLQKKTWSEPWPHPSSSLVAMPKTIKFVVFMGLLHNKACGYTCRYCDENAERCGIPHPRP